MSNMFVGNKITGNFKPQEALSKNIPDFPWECHRRGLSSSSMIYVAKISNYSKNDLIYLQNQIQYRDIGDKIL